MGYGLNLSPATKEAEMAERSIKAKAKNAAQLVVTAVTGGTKFDGRKLEGATIIKMFAGGDDFILSLKPEGTLEERPIHRPGEAHQGTWEVKENQLMLKIYDYTVIVTDQADDNGLYDGKELPGETPCKIFIGG